jgi:ribosomal protein S18 acetylase RimI-like enzyme
MMELTLNMNFLAPVDWPVLQEARLAALRESPHAFTSSYDHESMWEEPEWRRLLETATWIVAQESQRVVGLVRSDGEPGRSSTRHLESIWVAPEHRRHGVFRHLLHAVAEHEREMGATDLLLWVLEDNHDAQRAYETVGFEPTGERQFLHAWGRSEQLLRLSIKHLLDS